MHLYVTNTGISNVKKNCKNLFAYLKKMCYHFNCEKWWAMCRDLFWLSRHQSFLSLFLLEFINHVATGEEKKQSLLFGAQNLPLKPNKTILHFIPCNVLTNNMHQNWIIAPSNDAIWDEFSEQHQHQSTKSTILSYNSKFTFFC